MNWKAIGAKLGRALAALTPEAMRERIRARFAAKYGRCRWCDKPMADYSLSMICDHCHFDDLLKSANGGGSGGDA